MIADAEALTIATKSVLSDIAKHAHALAMGLQNAAPPQEVNSNKSVQYLIAVAASLEEINLSIGAYQQRT